MQTIIDGSNGVEHWQTYRAIKNSRQEFSLICFTSYSSAGFRRSLMISTPKIIRNGLAGTP
jgi:hypothetical protein